MMRARRSRLDCSHSWHERDGAFVSWRDIGYQNNYDPHSLDLTLAERVPTFVFGWPAYEAELRRYMPGGER